MCVLLVLSSLLDVSDDVHVGDPIETSHLEKDPTTFWIQITKSYCFAGDKSVKFFTCCSVSSFQNLSGLIESGENENGCLKIEKKKC